MSPETAMHNCFFSMDPTHGKGWVFLGSDQCHKEAMREQNDICEPFGVSKIIVMRLSMLSKLTAYRGYGRSISEYQHVNIDCRLCQNEMEKKHSNRWRRLSNSTFLSSR